MKRLVILLIAVVILFGTIGIVQSQADARLFGLTIWRDNADPPVVHCRFLYRIVGDGVHRVQADQFCSDNLTAVKDLGRIAFDFDDANPILDPTLVSRYQNLKSELEAAGFTVTAP